MRFLPRSSNLLIWAVCCGVAAWVLLAYACASLAAGRGEFLLPLDDVYIHFQYAKQLASGQPFVYNPGQPPTSGATSFLYPFILAAGYLLGFQGLNLSLWAMCVGAVALAGSAWLVYRLALVYGAAGWLALLMTLAFALTGAVSWHFMSGMETGLMILLVLATLYMVVTRRVWGFVVSASLLALMRPEGGVLAVIAVGVFALTWAQQAAPLQYRKRLVLTVPVLMLGVQPLVNWLVTGSPVATGNSAKSILGTVPFYWDEVIGRILANFARMWWEFFTGYSLREGWYVPLLLVPLGAVGLWALLRDREQRAVCVMLVLWLLAGTAAIATLDTAFWHFKRYQMPLLVLFYPLAAWGIVGILKIQRKDANPSPQTPLPQGERGFRVRNSIVVYGYGVVAAAFVVVTAATFLWAFALNVNYVYLQPLQMARWLEANTPEDALVAVHDVGMMRYMGGRTTLDMVGLTTPGAADYWRNGPGSVAEFLIAHRPDYIASYGHGHGYGLGMLAETSLYGEPLAGFPVQLDPNYNVALAADFQGIYAPDWRLIISANPFLLNMPLVPDAQVVNVANMTSERLAGYEWSVSPAYEGFVTQPYALSGEHCLHRGLAELDGARAVTEESFTIEATPGESLLLMTMFHPVERGVYDVYMNDVHLDRNWIPETPGCWSIARTMIPGEMVTEAALTIRIEAQTASGVYLPAHHAVIPQEIAVADTDAALAHFQGRSFGMTAVDLLYNPGSLLLGVTWYALPAVEGDYRLFVHVYEADDAPPVAQTDRYALHSPPGNWLPGEHRDTVMVNLDGVPPGAYRVAIGFYNPYTFERLMPESDTLEVSPDGRLFIGEIEVQ